MKPNHISIAILLTSPFLVSSVWAQTPASGNQSAAATAPAAATGEVPRLIKFSGALLDAQGRPQAGPVGVTFALYAQQNGGAALWLETQNVKSDANGNYTVLLGANSANGVPAELFASGEARWLGIQVGQQPEHERILLVSVPYALKAGDAETLGGLPASAFVTTATAGNAANPAGGAGTSSSTAPTPAHTQSGTTKATSTPQPAAACTGVTSDGSAKVNSIALFSTACNIEGSLMSQATINGFPGINLAGNNAGLLLNGTGTHQVTVTGATSGRLGQDANGFFFASDTKNASVRFLTNNGTLNEWVRITSAGNVGIGTQTPAAKLDVNGSVNSNSTISGTQLISTVATGTAPLSVTSTTMVPNLNASLLGGLASTAFATVGANFFTGNQNILGNVSVSRALSLPNTAAGGGAGVIALGGAPFLHNFGTSNTFVGQSAGNTSASLTGSSNNGVGFAALNANTSGMENDAFGFSALQHNTTGNDNDAFGRAALTANTTGINNSAFGADALQQNTIGSQNSAFGANALNANTTGNFNSAFGFDALPANTASDNSAFGTSALFFNTTGTDNTAVGVNALFSNTTGGANTAVGLNALESNSAGNSNTAIGEDSLRLTTGSTNIAIGVEAGSQVTTGSNNILIFDPGTSGDNQVIRIGTEGTQTQTFVAGISGTGVTGSPVLVSINGQLGIAVSTKRAKEDIHNMGDLSQRLLQLRPVTFRYRKPLADGSKPLQYGLVAEEVAEVMPELVVYGRDGQPETVQYHVLPALLLNEVQKQRRQINGQQERIRELTGEVRKLRKVRQAMAQLEARLANLESQQKRAQATLPNDRARDRSNGPGTTQGR